MFDKNGPTNAKNSLKLFSPILARTDKLLPYSKEFYICRCGEVWRGPVKTKAAGFAGDVLLFGQIRAKVIKMISDSIMRRPNFGRPWKQHHCSNSSHWQGQCWSARVIAKQPVFGQKLLLRFLSRNWSKQPICCWMEFLSCHTRQNSAANIAHLSSMQSCLNQRSLRASCVVAHSGLWLTPWEID